MPSLLKLISCTLLSSALLACGGGSGGGGSDTEESNILVSPSLGKVSQVEIEIFQADGETSLGSATIGEEGSIAVDIGSYQGPILAKMTALENASYYDEAVATTVDLPQGFTLHAIADSSVDTLAITLLTELAYQFAQVHEAFPLSETSVAMLNEAINTTFAPNISSILTPPTLLGATGVSGLADDEAGNYALVLAALAFIAEDDVSGQPAIVVLNALVKDIVDGRVDGLENGEAIAGAPYNSFAFAFNASLEEAALTYDYPGDTEASAVSDLVLALREPEEGTSTAEACSQNWQLSDGLSYQLVYELTEDLGIRTVSSSDTSVSSAVEFNGAQTFEVSADIEIVTSLAPAQTFEVSNLSYLSASPAEDGLLIHGAIETRMDNGFAIETVITNTPNELRRFDLSRGESYNQSFDQTVEQRANDIPIQNVTTAVEYDLSYEGREIIIVPAGAFEACKFSLSPGPRRESLGGGATVEFSGGDPATEFWISSGSGLLLRRVVGQQEELLLEATVAGQAITGNAY